MWAFKYDFTVTNNEAKYEVLITRVRMTKDLDVKKIVVFCDSQLVVNQITNTFEARGPRMVHICKWPKTWYLALSLFKYCMFRAKQISTPIG